MLAVKGRIVNGIGDFKRRMTLFPEIFSRATGEKLFPGTLNIETDIQIPPIEHFRIRGVEIGEPEQDLLFEVCRVNGHWAYRIRPWNLLTQTGGHGDHVLEIASKSELRPILSGDVTIELFR